MLRLIIFLDNDGEGTTDALVLLELQLGPLPLVDEVVKPFFQGFEDADIRAFHLLMIDRDTRIKLLRMSQHTHAATDEEAE